MRPPYASVCHVPLLKVCGFSRRYAGRGLCFPCPRCATITERCNGVKRLWLGIILILLTSGILLISDWNQRTGARGGAPRVALLQHASQKVFDDGLAGLKEALAEGGFTEGRNLSIQYFNAEGDVGTSNTIAKQMANGGYDLLLTMSTLSLQAVANANKDGRTRHVYGVVSDPSVAGVGVSAADPLDHPKYMAGIGSMQPVESAFRLARQCYPGLKKVGVVWNAGEANSLATIRIARAVSKQMGIELIEANADNTSAVREAADSVVARGAEAIWTGGDLTVIVAMDSVIGAARKGRIPVFSNIPDGTRKGALFDLGANFQEVGREFGKIAVDVLRGTDPATIPTRNVVPEKLYINRNALKNLRNPWSLPADAVRKADLVIDDQGIQEKTVAAERPLGKTWKLRFLLLNNAAEVEEVEYGFRQGLLDARLVEGRDYELKVSNAQADMATLNSLVDAALPEADLIIASSTPTLQVTMRKVDRTPVVFTYVADSVSAGVGRSREDHRANFTGVDVIGPYPEIIGLLREHFPSVRRIGTLFVPAESNMAASKDLLEAAAKKAGMELISTSVNTSADVADAALALTTRGIDAVVQIGGNITAVSFGAILQAANKAKLPVFAFTKPQAQAGAVVSLARDLEDGGRMTAAMVARIMRGESPRRIPIRLIDRTTLYVNLDGARAADFAVPAALIQRADQVIGQ